MSAVVDRVACPECGAQKGHDCGGAPHMARWEALWNLNRRMEAERQRPA